MKLRITKAYFINRAPLSNTVLDLTGCNIALLTSINGGGKTTILSHFADAFHELAKLYYHREYAKTDNEYYRVSSPIFSVDPNAASIVYIKYSYKEKFFHYIDIRGEIEQGEYEYIIDETDRIPYNYIKSATANWTSPTKLFHSINKDEVRDVFENELIAYFPSYRFEIPAYLNDPYKSSIEFLTERKFTHYLPYSIEAASNIDALKKWLLDILLDCHFLKDEKSQKLDKFFNWIIQCATHTKYPQGVKLSIGRRGSGQTRIQIRCGDQIVCPTLNQLSTGESSLLCVFGELLRRLDIINSRSGGSVDSSGIALIDEIDAHLNAQLQKDAVPNLMAGFSDTQFIVTAHSPFLGMGLEEYLSGKYKIFDLDKGGTTVDPHTSEAFKEVYEILSSNGRAILNDLEDLRGTIESIKKTVVITEGKTDKAYLEAAIKSLGVDAKFEIYVPEGDFGDAKLKALLSSLAHFNNPRKIVGIFDRDNKIVTKDIWDVPFKDHGNNVFSFCIPVPEERQSYKNLCIELYFQESDLKKEHEGRRLHFSNEVEKRINSTNNKQIGYQILQEPIQSDEFNKIVIEDNIGSNESMLSKTAFSSALNSSDEFRESLDFSNFKLIFDILAEIERL